MKAIYNFSLFGGYGNDSKVSEKPFNKKPTKEELKTLERMATVGNDGRVKDGKIKRNDNEIIFYSKLNNMIEVKARIGDTIAINRYSDIYKIINN